MYLKFRLRDIAPISVHDHPGMLGLDKDDDLFQVYTMQTMASFAGTERWGMAGCSRSGNDGVHSVEAGKIYRDIDDPLFRIDLGGLREGTTRFELRIQWWEHDDRKQTNAIRALYTDEGLRAYRRASNEAAGDEEKKKQGVKDWVEEKGPGALETLGGFAGGIGGAAQYLPQAIEIVSWIGKQLNGKGAMLGEHEFVLGFKMSGGHVLSWKATEDAPWMAPNEAKEIVIQRKWDDHEYNATYVAEVKD